MSLIYVNNTNLLVLQGLFDNVAQAYLNAATVTATVKDLAGTPVSGASWPKAMSYQAASNGVYQCILEDTIAFVSGQPYVAYISASGGTNKVGYWELSLDVRDRTAS